MRAKVLRLAVCGVFAGIVTMTGVESADARVPLADAQLDKIRGGIAIPTGLELGFGAVVRTHVDGRLLLESTLTWTDQGPVYAVTHGAETAELGKAAASAGLDLGRGQWRGLLLDGNGGATAVLHELGADRIVGAVVNTANDRRIWQEIEVTLTLPGLDRLQQQIAQERVGLQLGEALATSLRDAAAH